MSPCTHSEAAGGCEGSGHTELEGTTDNLLLHVITTRGVHWVDRPIPEPPQDVPLEGGSLHDAFSRLSVAFCRSSSRCSSIPSPNRSRAQWRGPHRSGDVRCGHGCPTGRPDGPALESGCHGHSAWPDAGYRNPTHDADQHDYFFRTGGRIRTPVRTSRYDEWLDRQSSGTVPDSLPWLHLGSRRQQVGLRLQRLWRRGLRCGLCCIEHEPHPDPTDATGRHGLRGHELIVHAPASVSERGLPCQ